MTLETGVGKIALTTPLIGASGLFGYGPEYGSLVDYASLGAVVAKTVTLKPREGNPPPRMVDVGGGIINSIGLENVGADAFFASKMESIALPCRLFVSIGGETVEEFQALGAMAEKARGIDAVEVNISCPNVARGGIAFGSDPESTRRVIKAVRGETGLAILAKVPPLASRVEEVSQAACDGGADALTVANTYPAIAIDVESGQPVLGGVSGGLSGPAIKPATLFLVWKVAQAISLPVVGCGGVETPQDVVEYILAGASAVQIGSVILRDAGAPARMLEGLKNYMERKGYAGIADFRGKALTG